MQGFNFFQQLKNAGQAFNQQKRFFPDLLIAVLPEQGTDIYTAIKQYVTKYQILQSADSSPAVLVTALCVGFHFMFFSSLILHAPRLVWPRSV